MFFRRFLKLFSRAHTFDADLSADHDARQTARRFARGNAALSAGHFLTREALERERREMANITF